MLLERDGPLSLLNALAQARERRGASVLAGGEAGVGKTALTEAFVDSLDRRSIRAGGLHGLPLTTTSEGAAKAFGRTVLAYLRGRLDTTQCLNATSAADPRFALLAHCMKGYFAMLAQRRSLLDVAADAHRAAVRLGALDTSRERAHVAALGSWVGGDVEGALKIWKQIIGEHPTDVIALRLAHFNDFWLGRAHDMLVTVAAARTHWIAVCPLTGWCSHSTRSQSTNADTSRRPT